MYGVLDSRKVTNQYDIGSVNSSRRTQVEQTPEPSYIKNVPKIDDRIYVSRISDDNLIQNPSKNIGNTTIVKNDIDDDINKLKQLKKGR